MHRFGYKRLYFIMFALPAVGLGFASALAQPAQQLVAGASASHALLQGPQAAQSLPNPAVMLSPAPPSPRPATPPPAPSPAPSGSSSPAPSPQPSAPPVPPSTPAPRPGQSAAPVSAPPSAAFPGGSAPGEPAPYERFAEGAVSHPGLFTVLIKNGKVYLELAPDQLDRQYLLVPMTASGLGEGLFSGIEFEIALIRFHRVGSQIITLEDNSHAKARPGSPQSQAVAISFPPSVISSDAIVAANKANGHIVFPADVFLSDIVDLTDAINGPPQLALLNPGAHYRLDPKLSYFGPAKAFPKNVDIESDLTFSSGSPGPIDTVPDARSLYVRLHYSIVERPDDNYQPRIADDRVGYFLTARRQYDSEKAPTSFVRYINRWNLQKTDPRARLSPAKNPITYYLSNDIPTMYREPIRTALLTWNKAFAAIGISDAVKVYQQPNDPAWDPDDVRYSVVRWVESPGDAFAYGPSFADPLTGEIIRADIVIDGNLVRSSYRQRDQVVAPTAILRSEEAPSPLRERLCQRNDCDYGEGVREQAQWGVLALQLDGRFGLGAMPDAFAKTFLQSIVLHESGHNLGLRHNFQSSTIYSMSQLHDKRFTATHGLVGSVMEYTPLNLSPHGQPQGDYFQTILGPYDYFAIRYGYQPISAGSAERELPALQAIASQATRPELTYGTDEDNAWFNGFATDPRVQQFDLSNDPLEFAQNQLIINQRLFATLGDRMPLRGHSYADERVAFTAILNSWFSAARIASRYVGGEYFTRNHRGDPHEKAPFRPVSRSTEQRAFNLLSRYAFADNAFHFSPALLNHLGDSRFSHWESQANQSGRLDYPLEEIVERGQLALLGQMWQPTVLARLTALESRVDRAGETMNLADLFDWTDQSIWAELGGSRGSVSAVHRALQHRYADMLIHILLKPDPGTPLDARSLARHHLRWLDGQLAARLRRGRLSEATQANYEDVQAEVARALNAAVSLPPA